MQHKFKFFFIFLIFVSIANSQDAGYSFKTIYDKNGIDIYIKAFYSWADWDHRAIHTTSNVYINNRWNKKIWIKYNVGNGVTRAWCERCIIEPHGTIWKVLSFSFKTRGVSPDDLAYSISWDFVK